MEGFGGLGLGGFGQVERGSSPGREKERLSPQIKERMLLFRSEQIAEKEANMNRTKGGKRREKHEKKREGFFQNNILLLF